MQAQYQTYYNAFRIVALIVAVMGLIITIKMLH